MRGWLIPIATLIIGAIIGTASDNLFGPVFQPLSPVIPTLSEQIQSFLNSVSEEGIRQAIQYAAIGYGEASIILISNLLVLLDIAMVLLVISIPFVLQERFRSKSQKISVVVPCCLLAIFFVYLMANEAYDKDLKHFAMQMTKSHQRNMTILTPYISDQEQEELNSLFALMKNRQDAQEIDRKVKALAEKHGLAW